MTLFLLLQLVPFSWAGKVLDLDRLEIQGQIPGPKFSFVESGKIDRKTDALLALQELRDIELDLLKEPSKGKKK